MIAAMNKQMRVRDHVADAIRRGELRPGQRLENDRALSVRLGVSRITLGRGLNMLVEQGLLTRKVGSGTYVTEVRERMSAAPCPPSVAGQVIPEKVGFVISASDSPVALALQQGMHQVFPKSGCDIVVKDPGGDQEEERRVVRDLLERGAGALVVATSASFLDTGARDFYRGVAAKVPLVFCDCALYDPGFNVVSTDNVLGGVMAAERLGSQAEGGRTYWVLRHDFPRSSLWERTLGFQHGLAARWAVEPGQVKTIALPSDVGRAGETLREHFQDGPAPDGIFVLTDGLFSLLLDAARRSGTADGKLNVCCFDNFFKTAELFDIPCLEQDIVRIGAEAARAISALLSCPGEPVRNVRFPPCWGRRTA